MSNFEPIKYELPNVAKKFNGHEFINELKTLDTKDPTKWSKHIWYLVWLFAALLSMGLAYYTMVMPVKKRMDADVKSRAAMLNEYRDIQTAYLDAEQRDKQLTILDKYFKEELRQLPKDSEIAELVQGITKAGRDSGLTINNINLSQEVPRNNFIEQPILMSVKGGFHLFGEFSSQIANLPRIVNIDDFSARVNTTKTNQQTVIYQIKANTYRYAENQNASATASTPAPTNVGEKETEAFKKLGD